MHWDYPVYVSPEERAAERSDSGTVGTAVRRALPRSQAFAWIAGNDPRPLLVLRECKWCNGTDLALLSATKANDKALLLAQWFHCVKLPNDVLDDDHPFRHLFPEQRIPHLFLCDRDGSGLIPLNGEQSRVQLWSAMTTVLARNYVRDAKLAVSGILKVLAQYDNLDSMEDLREEQLDRAIERGGPDCAKARKIRQQLEKLREQKKLWEAKEKELQDLQLRKPRPATSPAPAD